MTTLKNFLSTAVGVALVLALSGCGQQQAGSEDVTAQAPSTAPKNDREEQTAPPEPEVKEWIKVTSGEKVPMPLDPYLLSPENLKVVAVAKEVAAVDCMHDLGFSKWTAGTVRTWTDEGFVTKDFLEYLDPKTAAASGYSRTTPSVNPKSLVVPKREERTPSGDELAAFEGSKPRTESGKDIPTGGCIGAGEAKVTGSTQLPVDPLGLAGNTANWAFADSRVRAALKEWSACMTDAGHDYEQPFLVQKDPRWMNRDDNTPASAEEKQAAEADAVCQQKVNLFGTYLTIKQIHQENLVKTYATELGQAKDVTSTWTSTARTTLS